MLAFLFRRGDLRQSLQVLLDRLYPPNVGGYLTELVKQKETGYSGQVQLLTFSVLAWSSSTLAWSSEEAILYSSNNR